MVLMCLYDSDTYSPRYLVGRRKSAQKVKLQLKGLVEFMESIEFASGLSGTVVSTESRCELGVLLFLLECRHCCIMCGSPFVADYADVVQVFEYGVCVLGYVRFGSRSF
jgi:hypothetical protein